MSNPFKVRLVSVTNPRDRVIFESTPTISESRRADYASVTPVHLPGAIQVYKGSSSRVFAVNVKLISRNSEEATLNKQHVQLIRSWVLPYFGRSSTKADPIAREQAAVRDIVGDTASTSAMPLTGGAELLGAPPQVLYFYGYSSSSEDARAVGISNINRIPVVLETYDLSYPDDVDYIPTLDNGTPFPVRMEISMSLIETHSPTEYSNFSLQLFKQGKLPNF